MQKKINFEREDFLACLETLKKGGVVLYPTDTVWGIGCDATNQKAVEKIFQIKKRAESKSMLVLLDCPERLQNYVETVPEVAWDLVELSEKPLTVIFSGARGVAQKLLADDGSLGVRITKEEFSEKLCQALGRPIVSTSANVSGENSPRFFDEISQEIIEKMDYVVRFRRTDKTPKTPSSIIKLSPSGEVKIIRE